MIFLLKLRNDLILQNNFKSFPPSIELTNKMADQQQNARRWIPSLVISIFSFTKVIGVQQDNWSSNTITNNIVHEMVQHNSFAAQAENVKPKEETEEKGKAPQQQEIGSSTLQLS
jgi:TolB-like protein